ncbi:hypothetical protein ACTHQ1_03610 [Janibacter anophelis]|uniref:hypothetical protein n=1 Tax=Janibacter anophelis TaxID=319054 RepID=UPI003F7F6651
MSVYPNSPLPRLDWFPKAFSQGDIDGEGAQKLLGKPNVPLPSVLVRETAQNSWDAKAAQEAAVEFTLNLRRLSAGERSVLFGNVLTGGLHHLGKTPTSGDSWVLEIADRGTVGLGGPIRNDLALAPGQKANFNDLIFNIGAPRDAQLSGGTYGFGKTIAYVASSLRTVAFWTRCSVQGVLEHRFIASGMGASFDQGGRRYTGRHWWGRTVDDGARVEPVVGDSAKVLGEAIFTRPFRAQETGTSMLIVAPVMPDGPNAFVEELSSAAVWHLWPKLVADESGRQPMRIEVQLEGERVGPPELIGHPVLTGMVQALKGVRAAQTGGDVPDGVVIKEIRSLRPNKIIGHLGLTMTGATDVAASEVEDAEGIRSPAHHVAFMRHAAELVVKYQAGPPLGSSFLQWAGVFKPVLDTDDSFAAAEPPAHDDWIPAAVADRRMKRDVNMGLKRIKTTVDEFVLPAQKAAGDHHTESGAALGESLADLVGASPGNTPRRVAAGGGGAGSKKQTKPKIEEAELGPESDGRRRHAVRVSVPGDQSTPTRLELDLRIATEGGAVADDGMVKMEGWLDSQPDWDAWKPSGRGGRRCDTLGGRSVWAVFSAPNDVAVEVQIHAVDAS